MAPRDQPLEAAPDAEDLAALDTAIEAEVGIQVAENDAADRSSRIARTTTQVAIPAALVGIFSWQARLHGLDLDPGAGVDLPADVAGYLVAVLTAAGAWAMNRSPKG